jgi:hypothetical protein
MRITQRVACLLGQPPFCLGLTLYGKARQSIGLVRRGEGRAYYRSAAIRYGMDSVAKCGQGVEQ